MTRRGDDGGFEGQVRRYIGERFAVVKPQDADEAGDIIIMGAHSRPLVGEAKHYRARAQGNPLARMINDSLTEAAAEAELSDGIPFGICKRHGKAAPGEQLVVMTVDSLMEMLGR